MNLLATLQIALRALYANKLRSALTMLGVIIGVASVILLVAIGSGLQSFVTAQFEELGTDLLTIFPGKVKFGDTAGREGGPPGASNNKLTREIAELIGRRSAYAIGVTPVATTFAKVKFLTEKRTTGILGTTPNYKQIRKSPTANGRFFNNQEFSIAKRVAVIGKTTANKLFGGRSPLGKKIKIAEQTFRVVGVFAAKGAAFGNDQDDLVAIPLTTFERVFNLDKVSYIYVKVSTVAAVQPAKREIQNILLAQLNAEEFSVIDPKKFLSTVSSILNVITAGLAGIAAISLVVGGIGIANIMLVSVTERIREIGLRKAVGATGRDILLQFLTEAALLSLVGGAIGILLGTGGALILNRFVATAVTAWSVVAGFVVSALTGIISGVGPAIKAARMNPIDALRYE